MRKPKRKSLYLITRIVEGEEDSMEVSAHSEEQARFLSGWDDIISCERTVSRAGINLEDGLQRTMFESEKSTDSEEGRPRER